MKSTLLILVTLAAAAFLLSQQGQQARPLNDLIPAGPLLYIEARDLGTALKDWNSSKAKADWTAGDNYKVFSQTRLFMKLDQAQQEYAAAAGLTPDMPFLEAVAGSNSALALYDIGDLAFLYVTRLPQARAYQTALWQARAKFQPRRSAGIDYYIRQQQGRRAAFAVTNDLLLIATDEQAIARALSLIAGQNPARMREEQWYRNAIAAQPQAGEFRMVHNFARVLQTPYFRSYWVQRNSRDLAQFASFISDMDRSPAEFRERRVLLREEPAADLRPAESAVAELVRLAPPDAGLYRAWARPEAGAAASLITGKLLGVSLTTEPQRRLAPLSGNIDAVTGTEQDIEVRIDEAPLTDDSRALQSGQLRSLLEGNTLLALLEVQTAQPAADGAFVTAPFAVAVLGERPWDAAAARTAVATLVANRWTVAGLGAGWTGGGNVQTLNGLGKAAVWASGRVLIIGDSGALIGAMASRGSAPNASGAAYSARFQHARELPKFERMMRLIDAPSLRSSTGDSREPMFFSENIASLGRALGSVGDVSIESHDDGRLVRQTMVYKLQ
jgi:hypothetical protein